MTLDGARRTPAISAGAGLIGFTFLEVLRVWFPSVLFVAGDAGDTSALAMAAFGVACLGVAPLLALLLGRLGPRSLWRIGAGALVLGRGALILQPGGSGRLAASSLAAGGASIAVVALAAGSRADRTVRVGLFAGVVAATCLHAATRTVGLVWPGTTTTMLVSVGVLGVLALTAFRADPHVGGDTAISAVGIDRGGAAWPWFALTPMLVLIGTVSGVPGRTAVAIGWSGQGVAATVAGAHVGALIAAAVARRIGPARAGLLAAAGIAGGTVAGLDASGLGGVLGQVALALGLGLLLGSDLGATVRPASDRRRGVAAGSAVLAAGVLIAAYYTAYDIALPFNNRLLLLGTALLGSGLSIATFRMGREATVRATFDVRRFAQRLTAAVVAVAVVAVLARPVGNDPAGSVDPDVIRVATYNIRFGFDLDGRFAASQQARLLRAHRPDVVLLNEVDRGWLTSGGHDALEIIAEELGLPHVRFTPAADEVWGNALLSRYPIVESASEVLPSGNDPMGRSQLAAVLDIDGVWQLGVVGTHLSHRDDQGDTRLPQARAVAATVAVLRERQVPTVVLGDLNAPPGSSELATFDPLVTDMLPAGTDTYPSDLPTDHIDHVLASSELRRAAVFLPQVTYSDHLPVIVDLRYVPSS